MTQTRPRSGARVRLPFLIVSACSLILAVSALGNEPTWWDDAVFYEVFVRSFYDADSDGIGDLRGLIEKLDYLNDGDPTTTDDLGVTALWLMPICESPSYHGYDVTDYYAIESDYGTMADFRELLDEAHERGIRVIVDLVLNHTSSDHPWFNASRGPDSEFRDWYVWTTGLPPFTGPGGQRVWHFGGTGYYYGFFWSGMPDLNYRTPAVTLAALHVVRYWLREIEVDGFRLDAIRHLIEDGEQLENTPETHSWLKGFRATVKGWKDDALLLGEVWDAPSAILPYYDAELDICFEFSLADAILGGVRASSAGTIEDALAIVLATYPEGRYATFLSNHDQERVMSRLGGNTERAKLAATILLTLPGTPFIYYGEEIGMTGTKPDERIRTPMQWSAGPGGGFTAGTPWEPLAVDAADRTVADQIADADSLLARYRTMIDLRNKHAVLRTGSTAIAETGHMSLLSYLRYFGDRVVWVLHNLSAFPARPTTLAVAGLLEAGTYRTTDLVSGDGDTFTLDSEGILGGGVPAVPPLGSLILELLRVGA